MRINWKQHENLSGRIQPARGVFLGQPPLLRFLGGCEMSLHTMGAPLSAAAAAAARRRHPLVLNRLQPVSFASEQTKAVPAASQTGQPV